MLPVDHQILVDRCFRLDQAALSILVILDLRAIHCVQVVPTVRADQWLLEF